MHALFPVARLAMLKNHLFVALRSLSRHRGIAAVNLFGLGTAMAVCLFVIAFVRDQSQYDTFHPAPDRLYRLTTTLAPAADQPPRTYATSPAALAPLLDRNDAAVEATARVRPVTDATARDERRLTLDGFYADPSFFDVFGFQLLAGSPSGALARPGSVVLSEAAAHRLFGDTDPLGQPLTLQAEGEVVVTGLVATPPVPSHLAFDALLPFPPDEPAGLEAGWSDPRTYTYVRLAEQARADHLADRLGDLVRTHHPARTDGPYALDLQPVTAINLGPVLARQVGRLTPRGFAYFLAALAVVIMLAAGINYVNLSLGRALQRRREVGVRKAVGAARRHLVGQFLGEAVVTAGLALIVGYLLYAVLLLPLWNRLSLTRNDFGHISSGGAEDVLLLLLFLGFAVGVGLLAGAYPALHLSRLAPTRILRGAHRPARRRGGLLSRGLITVQFALSFVFIVSTLLLVRQAAYLFDADYGFRRADVFNVELGSVPYEVFREAMISHAGVAGVSAGSGLFAVSFPERRRARRTDAADSATAAAYRIDEHAVDNLGLTLVAGRNVSAAFGTDEGRAVLLNETAVQALGLDGPEDAVGTTLALEDHPDPVQVVGVVRDFQFDFLWQPVTPLVLHYHTAALPYAHVRVHPGGTAAALAHLEAVWNRLEPVAPLAYRAYDDEIATVYDDFRDLAHVIGLLAVLAIAIASLGLLATAHARTAARTKEIGIRKALGAGVPGLAFLLSADFLALVGIALVLGGPGAWFLNTLWLRIFANRIDLEPGVFAAGAGCTILAALLAVGTQTLRAARANPVDALRYE